MVRRLLTSRDVRGEYVANLLREEEEEVRLTRGADFGDKERNRREIVVRVEALAIGVLVRGGG